MCDLLFNQGLVGRMPRAYVPLFPLPSLAQYILDLADQPMPLLFMLICDGLDAPQRVVLSFDYPLGNYDDSIYRMEVTNVDSFSSDYLA